MHASWTCQLSPPPNLQTTSQCCSQSDVTNPSCIAATSFSPCKEATKACQTQHTQLSKHNIQHTQLSKHNIQHTQLSKHNIQHTRLSNHNILNCPNTTHSTSPNTAHSTDQQQGLQLISPNTTYSTVQSQHTQLSKHNILN